MRVTCVGVAFEVRAWVVWQRSSQNVTTLAAVDPQLTGRKAVTDPQDARNLLLHTRRTAKLHACWQYRHRYLPVKHPYYARRMPAEDTRFRRIATEPRATYVLPSGELPVIYGRYGPPTGVPRAVCEQSPAICPEQVLSMLKTWLRVNRTRVRTCGQLRVR